MGSFMKRVRSQKEVIDAANRSKDAYPIEDKDKSLNISVRQSDAANTEDVNEKSGTTDEVLVDTSTHKSQTKEKPNARITDGAVPIEAVDALINRRLEEHQAKLSEQVRAIEAERDAALQQVQEFESKVKETATEYEEKLQQAQTNAQRVIDLFSLTSGVGNSLESDGLKGSKSSSVYSPQVFLSHRPNTGSSAWHDVTQVLKQCDGHTVLNDSGSILNTYDIATLGNYLKSNTESALNGLTYAMKKDGFLKGDYTHQRSSDAVTTPDTIPEAYFTVLSGFMRMTHSPLYIFNQFVPNTQFLRARSGDTVAIPRIHSTTESDNLDDYNLTLVTTLDTTGEPMASSNVKIVLQEYGRGKNINVPLVSLPEFITMTSAMQLLPVLNDRLYKSYLAFEDRLLRTPLYSSTAVVYAGEGDQVVSAVGDIPVGGGTFTSAFLNNLNGNAISRGLQPQADGHFILVLNYAAATQLVNDLRKSQVHTSKLQISELTSMLSIPSLEQTGIGNGYQFTVNNCHVFLSNAIGIGAPGSEGVQTEDGATTRTSFLLGRAPVGRALVMPFNIRAADSQGFGRNVMYTWNTVQGAGALDIDPLSNPPESDSQQLGVIKIHTLDTPKSGV